MQITRKSPFSGTENTMDLDVTPEQMERWKNGVHAQDAFPNLNADEREFIMTGITNAEWDNIFGKEGEPK